MRRAGSTKASSLFDNTRWLKGIAPHQLLDLFEFKLESTDDANFFHRRAGGAVGTGFIIAVAAEYLDRSLVGGMDFPHGGAGVCGELLCYGAGMKQARGTRQQATVRTGSLQAFKSSNPFAQFKPIGGVIPVGCSKL